MSPNVFAVLVIAAAYLIGAIPFGYVIARSKGIDLFTVGSGNIGATNVGRVLGRKYGILVFLLDFLKGAAPVALVPALLRLLPSEDVERLWQIDWLRVGVALAAFLGHMFPIYLKFRGGKGVATGAGTMFVLVPGPAAIALLIWLTTVASFRIVSLASIVAGISLVAARLVSSPLAGDALILTGFCLAGAALVVVRHHANIRRLVAGTENRLGEKPMFDCLHRALHLLALAMLLGGSVFFNFLAAPALFASFKDVAKTAPSDRTAYVPISQGLDDAKKEQLGNALAGAAVGPIFPLFFAMQGICAAVALITSLGWWKSPGRANRWRVYLLGQALLTVAIGWPIAQKVTDLRLARFSPDSAVAEAAKSDFATWHLVSLALSFVTILFAFAATLLAARLPTRVNQETPST
jgi:acyl-phosphate glycerol 3-phosphate acyltransferase